MRRNEAFSSNEVCLGRVKAGLWSLRTDADKGRDGHRNVRSQILIAKAGLCAALASLGGCGAVKSGSGSTVHLQFPSFSSDAGERKPSALSVSNIVWANACFIVNVTTPEIPATKPAGACAIPFGVFAGSVAPGGSLDLSVPNGTGRSLDVYAYVRPSNAVACPSLTGGFGTLDLSKIVRVGGSAAPFDTKLPDVSVDVNVAAPAAATDVVAQLGLPPSCRPTGATVGPGLSRVLLGSETLSGSNGTNSYVMHGAVSPMINEINLLGANGFQAKLTRQPQ